MKRRVVTLEAYREFLLLRWNSEKCDETSLRASYGSYYDCISPREIRLKTKVSDNFKFLALIIGDAMTFVHVTELEYNFVLDKISMVTC